MHQGNLFPSSFTPLCDSVSSLGFEQSSESRHVKEITEKLANFVIETDTDTSNFPTDTGEFKANATITATRSQVLLYNASSILCLGIMYLIF